jgi:hypothetical protein
MGEVKMPSRSVGGARSGPRRPSRQPQDLPEDAFDSAPATIVDPHPPFAFLWRRAAREEGDGLGPSDAPTRESKDVVQALAAHEFSLARARRARLGEAEVVEELELSEIEELSPAPEDDFEDYLPTRIKTPHRR